MNATLSVQELWSQIRMLPASQIRMLPAGERHWLANKLYDYEEVYEEEEERLTPYTMEELNARIDRSLADAKAGRTYTSDEVRQFMEAKHPWLCE